MACRRKGIPDQNRFDGAGETGDAGAARLNKQVHVPAVTVAHLNAAAVSNTAIAPSSSLLPPLSSRRSAGARRVATAAAASVALPPPQCRFSRRRSATPPPGIVSHTCRDMCVLCLIVCSSILIARELKKQFCQPLTASPAPSVIPSQLAPYTTRASESPDFVRQK